VFVAMEEHIISAVYKREEIWNPKHCSHKNVNFFQKKWMDIAEEVGRDGDFLLLLFLSLFTLLYLLVQYNLYLYKAEHQVTELFI
jgi:hypothetical protein